MNIDKSDGVNNRSANPIGPDSASNRSAETVVGTAQSKQAAKPPASEPLTLSAGLQAILDNSRTSLSSEIDGQRVEGIRQAIADGSYHVDPDRLAASFLELESIIDQ